MDRQQELAHRRPVHKQLVGGRLHPRRRHRVCNHHKHTLHFITPSRLWAWSVTIAAEIRRSGFTPSVKLRLGVAGPYNFKDATCAGPFQRPYLHSQACSTCSNAHTSANTGTSPFGQRCHPLSAKHVRHTVRAGHRCDVSGTWSCTTIS
jgi:hypothetical protein